MQTAEVEVGPAVPRVELERAAELVAIAECASALKESRAKP
jgi:hypothetical protein